MRSGAIVLLVALLFVASEPAWSLGMAGAGQCSARNPMEVYCLSHGGCPRDGYCYFPDGYCELEAFYNGTCPGREYYEQAIWMADAYRFLYGDEVYSPYGLYYPYYYYYWPVSYWP